MALTATVKTDLYRFFAIAFDAAPGVTYMTQLAEASAAGMTVEQIVEVFTTKQQFTATYPAFLTAGDFAAKLVNNVVGGSASDAAKAEAAADIEAALSAGWSRGKVIYQVFNNLASLTGDPKWGGTAAQMANQVAYAQYYTEVLLGDTTNLATLRGVIAGVTPVTDVTPAAIDAVLNPPPVVVVPSYALSANAASADEGASVLFTLTTANVAAGSTFAYTLAGITASDVVGGSLTGVATVGSDGKAIVQVNLAADATTDGAKTMTLSMAGQTAAVAVNDTSVTPVVAAPTYTLAAAGDVAEGSVATFVLQTTGLAAGSQVAYKVTGTGTAAGQTATGVFTVDAAGQAAVSVLPPANKVIGDAGTLKIELLNGMATAVTVPVSDATPTTYGLADLLADIDVFNPVVTFNVAGTAAQTITLETDGLGGGIAFAVKSSAAPVTVVTGSGDDQIFVQGSMGNTVSTGDGNDDVTISGVGSTTINVGAGFDRVTAGSGKETVVVEAGELGAGDTFDLGAGVDTVVVAGEGNTINDNTFEGVENLVLDGTSVTFESLGAFTSVNNISGHADSSDITITMADGEELDLTAASLSGIRSLSITGDPVESVTIVADAASLASIGSIVRAVDANDDVDGPQLTLVTNVAGALAATAIEGEFAAYEIEDTFANVLAAADDLADLDGADITISDEISGDDALTLAGSAVAGASGVTVSMTVAELLTAANYPDQLDALTADMITIIATGSATVAQAASLEDSYGDAIKVAIADTPANVVGAAGAVWGIASSVALTAGAAISVADAQALDELAGDLADDDIALTGTYKISDLAATISTQIGSDAVKGAASVSITDDVVTDVDVADDLQTLGNLDGGYSVEFSKVQAQSGAAAIRAIAGADAAHLTGTFSIADLGPLRAANAAVTVDVIEDTAVTLVAFAARLTAATEDIIVTGSNPNVTQAKVIAPQLARINDAGGAASSYTVEDTKAALLAAGSADVVAGAGEVVVRDAMTIEQALALSGLNEDGDLTYGVTDTAAAFLAQLGAEDTEGVEAVLEDAGTVKVSTALTVSEALDIAGQLAAAGAVYSVSDTAANLFEDNALDDAAITGATKVSVTTAVDLAELADLLALGAKFDGVYSVKDTLAALAAADTANLVDAVAITATGVATVADLAGLGDLNAALEDAGNPAVSYALAGNYAAIMAALSGPNGDLARAATKISITGTLGAGPDQITAEGLVDDLAPVAESTPYEVKVTGDAAEIMAATSLILRSAVVTAIEIDEDVSAQTAFDVIDDIGTVAAAKLSYSLSDSADNLTDGDFADVVAGASSLTVTGGPLTVEEAAAVAAAAADADLTYDIQDDYSEIAGNLAIAGGAGTLTVNDDTLSVSAYTALVALEVATLNAGPITDTAAAVSGASAAVLAEAAGNGLITLTDVGALSLTVEQATALLDGPTYALAPAGQQPAGAAATVKVVDTTAAILALIAAAGGVDAAALAAQAVLNTGNTYKITATDVESMDVDTATAFAEVTTASDYELADSAANLRLAADLVEGAAAVAVEGATAINDAAALYDLNASISFEEITGLATVLDDKDGDGVSLYTGVLRAANLVTLDGAPTVTQVRAVAAVAGATELSYSISDTAKNIGNSANVAIVSAAEALTVSEMATGAQATVLASYIDQITNDVLIKDGADKLLANLSAIEVLVEAGGSVTVDDPTTVAVETMTVAQYVTLVDAIGGEALTGTVKDSAAAIANYLLADEEFDRAAQYSTNKTVNAAQAEALNDADYAVAQLKVVDTSSNLLSAAPANAASYQATDTVDLATAKQLYAAFSDALVVSVATTQDRFISAYEYEGGDADAQAVMQLASSLTVAGKAVVLGSQVDLLVARDDSDLSQAITGTAAELAALPAALLETAGYVVIDSVAHITAAANQALVAGSMGYIANDSAANLIAAGTAVLSTASGALGIVVDGAASVAAIDELVDLAPSLASYTTYSLTDTAAALAASDLLADAVTVTATDLADAEEADAILSGNEDASVAVSDTAAALIAMVNLASVSSAAVKGTATVADADQITSLVDTVTVSISDVMFEVAFAPEELLAAAVSVKISSGTLTVNNELSADALAKLASLTNLTGGFKVEGAAADLTDAELVSLADLAKATTVTVTDSPVSVAEANVLLTLTNLAKVGGSGANATKPNMSVEDTAVKMASFSAANLAAIGGTATVMNFTSSLTAKQATDLAALDAGSSNLVSDSTPQLGTAIAAADWAGAKIKDTSDNLLLAANKAVLAKVGDIEISNAVTVATFNAVKAADTLAVNTTFTYKLVDSVAGLIVAGAGVIDNASSVQVTGTTAFADAQSIVTAAGVGTTVKFDLLTGKAEQLVTGANLSDVGAKGTLIDVTDAATVAQAEVLAATPKLTGGYTVADDAVAIVGAINTDDGKALLEGATTVSLKAGAFASVEEAVVIRAQLSNENSLAIKDTAAALSATSAATAVAQAASVTVVGTNEDDGVSRSVTTAKVTYAVTDLDQMEQAGAGWAEIFDADSTYANPSTSAASAASALDVLQLKKGDVIDFSSLFAAGGDLTTKTGFTKIAAFKNDDAAIPEYRADKGFFTAVGDFVLSGVGTDTLLSFDVDGDGTADKVIVLVGTTTVTGVNATGSTTKVVGLTGG